MLEEVLPAIRAGLHRLTLASIRVPRDLALELFAHLDQPAPRLYRLALSLKLPADEAPVDLPHDLFRDSCPRLHSLLLKNIVLPPSPIPILAGVDIAVYQHTFPRVVTFPVAFFLKAAPLRIVELMAGDFILPEDLWSATVQDALRQLESISLTYSDDQSNIVSVLPLQDIPEVILAPPKIPAGRLVMAHLDGPLRLDITSNERGTADTIVAYAPADTSSTKQRRSFLDVQADFFDKRPDINPAPFYFDTAYTDRITSLTVSSSRWRIVTKHAPRLPRCTSLTLELDDAKYLRLRPRKTPPAFPLLGILTLRLANAEISCAGWRNLALHVGELPDSCRLVFETVSLDFFDDDWLDTFHEVDVR
ncbi:hypothetical protein EXIGLDRAFT_733604 [Exidia glandulosa HHB12029]|uniref:F-box domain-containing protein n=1 Tax=Exidia glandulosa HHB12029 TaxID=1314781 RepID=A0A165KF60_EXIGL|nr:hypothetical protein EXIGLDRAFT_733604 [Exidia glandulosa HHB12029]